MMPNTARMIDKLTSQTDAELELLLKTVWQLHYAFAVYLEADERHERVAKGQLVESIAAVISQAEVTNHWRKKEGKPCTQMSTLAN